MSTTSYGASLERRFNGMLINGLGYSLLAKAVRTPIYVQRRGLYSQPRVVGGGATDLAEGTIDAIFSRLGSKVLLVQITTINGLSPRRAKLREILPRLPMEHVEVVLAGWDRPAEEYRIFRPEADFMDEGFRMDRNSRCWPWEKPIELLQQETL